MEEETSRHWMSLQIYCTSKREQLTKGGPAAYGVRGQTAPNSKNTRMLQNITNCLRQALCMNEINL
jgi:hypothetical protein